MNRMKSLNGYRVYDEKAPHFVDTLPELKAALAAKISPIVMASGAEIEVSETLNVPEDTVFEGNGASFKRASGFEGCMFSLSPRCVLRNFTIDGNREAMVSPSWDKTMEIATRERCVVENVEIVNGNEAIVCYGADVLVSHCRILNCGGNGIHFSDAPRTRVESCTVIGANKREGMGHEGGCISWSMECPDIVVENCYLEDGLAGLGYIKVESASRIKIVGNTVKDCAHGVYSIFQTSLPKEVLISNNQFINSGDVEFNRTDENTLSEGTWLISNNLFDGTILDLYDIYPCTVEGNIFKNIKEMMTISNTRYAVIRGNTFIGGTGTSFLYLPHNDFMIFEGNTVSVCDSVEVSNPVLNFQGNSVGCVVRGNVIEILDAFHTSYAMGTTGVEILEGNRLSLKSGKGIDLGSNKICSGNVIVCSTAEQRAVFVSGDVTGSFITNNLTNGALAINSQAVTQINNGTCTSLEFLSEV